MDSKHELRTERISRRPDTRVVERIDLSCERLGFEPPPPVPVSIKLIEIRGQWSLYALFAPGEAPAIKRWLDLWNSDAIETAPGIYPRVIRARFELLPPRWEWVRSGSGMWLVSLVPQGNATLVLMGERYGVPRLKEVVPAPTAMKVPIGSQNQNPAGRVRLTPKQQEVLSLAVTFGYYEVPHRIDLRALARKLGRSLASVSSLLRRAEAQVLTNYVTDALVSEWEEHDPPSKTSPIRLELP